MAEATPTTFKSMSPLLVVAGLENAISFYTGQLGFGIDFRYEDFYAGIVKDGFSIHLKEGKTFTEERKRRKAEQDIDITFTVSGIEELYEDFSRKAIEIIQPLRQMPYGKEFYIADPDGYIHAFLDID